jgi:ABC-type Na+ transport system ATPase subunit NatA
LGTGERTALALTAALLTQSAVFLLDDALPGVEGRVRTQLTGSIREAIENGAALIAASDGRADELTELCGHIATLRGGRLYADFLIRTPAEHV